MDINRNNYEHFLLDYMEGRLSPDQREIVDRFLKFNPDLAEEFSSLSVQQVEPLNVEFSQKEALKKYIPASQDKFNPEQFEMYAIAYLEGDLTETQKADFKNFLLEHPGLQQQLEQFRNTHIEPEHIKYPFKQKLKKSNNKSIVLRYLAPVAAAAAVLLMIFINIPDAVDVTEVASVEVPEEKPESKVKKDEVKDNVQTPKIIQQSATVNLIKNNKAPVPVSTYKKDEIDVVNNDKAEPAENSSTRRITGMKKSPTIISEVPVKYDQIKFVPVNPPSVNLASLSFEDIARNQFERVNYALQNEDDLLVNLVSSGLKELNKRTGTKAELLASRNEEGDLKGVYFKSRFLQFSAPVSSDE